MSRKRRKKQYQDSQIYLEGNKGGDYVLLQQSEQQKKNSVCFLEVGHCCIVYIKAVVPVEFITALFAEFEAATVGKTLASRILSRLPWEESFNEELANKVREEQSIYLKN